MTYEYVCGACGHEWEAQQSIKDAPLRDCPSCGQGEARRQISRGAGFILKGGGWYSDLYASTGASAASVPKESSSESSSSTSAPAAAATPASNA